MIELEALREQLRLLGHDLPDDQIVGILQEMHIDFRADRSDEVPASSAGATRAELPQLSQDSGPGPANTSSQPTSPHARQHQQHRPAQHQPSAYTYTGYQSLSSAARGGVVRQPGLLDMPAYQGGAVTHDGTAATLGRSREQLEADDAVVTRLSSDFHAGKATGARLTSSAAYDTEKWDEAPVSAMSAGAGAEAYKPISAAKQPHEWYGKLSGTRCQDEDREDALPKVAHRSLLQELNQGGQPTRAKHTAEPHASIAPQDSFWAEDAAPDGVEEPSIRDRASFAQNSYKTGKDSTAAAMHRGGSVLLKSRGLDYDLGDVHDFDDDRASVGRVDQDGWAVQQARGAGAGGQRGNAGGGGGHGYPSHSHKDASCYGGMAQQQQQRCRTNTIDGAEYLYDDLGDDVHPVPDAEDSGLPANMYRPPTAAPQLRNPVPGGLSAEQRAALRGAAAAAAGGRGPAVRPAKYSWQDHLRSTSPVASSVVSMPRSVASTAAGSRGSSKPGAGPKKVDRVKRYQQMQQAWGKDSFLKHSAGKPANFRQAGAQSRKPDNFHSYFAIMHAMEAEDRARAKSAALSKTSADLRPGLDYVAPTSKRRDALRWEMRTRMQA